MNSGWQRFASTEWFTVYRVAIVLLIMEAVQLHGMAAFFINMFMALTIITGLSVLYFIGTLVMDRCLKKHRK